MVYRGKISPETAAIARLYYEESKLTVTDIAKKLNIGRRSIYRLIENKKKEKIIKKKSNARKSKVNERQWRKIKRALKKLRLENGNFTMKNVLTAVGLSTKDISLSTISRLLKKKGYSYSPAKRKGVLTKTDTVKRLKFAREIKKNYPIDVWTTKVAFYIDAVSFYYKRNPMDYARVPRGKIWKKKNEALDINCTARGCHVGSGGKILHLLVAISYQTGVILCDQYEHMDGDFYYRYVLEKFRGAFVQSQKNSKMFVQDGDPSQNSAKANRALNTVRAKLLKIPARSPDLNPIESLFAYVKPRLHKQALEQKISTETFEQFSERVKTMIRNTNIRVINNIIASMPTRIDSVIAVKGKRTKY